MGIFVGVGSVDQIVAGHDGFGCGFFHHNLKAGQVDLPQGAFVQHGVRRHAAQLLAVDGEVLGAGGDAVGLDAPHIACGHLARKVRVLGEVLEVAAAEGAALGVEARAQQYGGFVPHGLADLLTKGGVPAACHSDSRGEAGGRHTGIQPQMVRRPGLLAHAVGAIGQGNGRDTGFGQCAGGKGPPAGEQGTFLFKRQSLQLFLLHKVVPFLKNSLAAHRTTAQSRQR